MRHVCNDDEAGGGREGLGQGDIPDDYNVGVRHGGRCPTVRASGGEAESSVMRYLSQVRWAGVAGGSAGAASHWLRAV